MNPSAVVILAMLPLGVFSVTGFKPRAAPPIAPLAVQTESITERRADDATFRRRWPAELPPAVVIREVPVPVVAEAAGPTPSPQPARIVKRASLRRDICAVHGLKKVDVVRGQWKGWRCQR